MTITTAKRPARALLLTPLALAAMLVSAECRADWKFTPSMGLAETYSDNPGLLSNDQAHGQFITESIPGFTLSSRSRRLQLNASADWHFYAYQHKDTPNLHDRERSYNGRAEAIVIEDLLSVVATADASSRATSAFGPQFSNLYSATNRTDIKTWSIAPTLRHRFGQTANLMLQATRDSVSSNQLTTTYGDSLGSTVTMGLDSGANFSTLGWGLQYTHQNLDSKQFGSTKSENANASLRYRLGREWTALATVGYDDYEYAALRDRTAGRSYTAGFSWTPSSRTSIEASFGRRYFGKTGSLAATSRNRYLVSRVVYSDQITTNRQQFLLPSALDTAALLDDLLRSTIPDAAARADAVQAYIKASGLPPSLANDVNYLSNRYLREKRLQAAYIINMPHSSLVLSAYKSERTALSSQQSDSALLGSQFAALNDNVRQRGVDANFSYRLSSRTSASLTAGLTRATSLTTGIVSPSKAFSAGMTRRFDRKTTGSVELRHLNTSLNGSTGYTENALAATLTVQF
jgi:uncharacterized protein (PEP-CTERM system associated)